MCALANRGRELSGELVIVMRTYFEKPRTRVGWKGLINDPGLDGSFDIAKGLREARKLLLDINRCACVSLRARLALPPSFLFVCVCPHSLPRPVCLCACVCVYVPVRTASTQLVCVCVCVCPCARVRAWMCVRMHACTCVRRACVCVRARV